MYEAIYKEAARILLITHRTVKEKWLDGTFTARFLDFLDETEKMQYQAATACKESLQFTRQTVIYSVEIRAMAKKRIYIVLRM